MTDNNPTTTTTTTTTSSTAATGKRTPWTAADYGMPIDVTRGAAWKLADSGVAPLVAQARGYEAVADRDAAKAFAAKQRSADGRTRTLTSLTGLLHDGLDDVLTMPWYGVRTVAEDGFRARARDFQYRPSTPEIDVNGKARKYQWLPGAEMALDLHPATPAAWIDDSNVKLALVEGLLKADSLLTALLIETAGFDELGLAGDRDEALTRLQALMEKVPAQLAVLPVATASVTTWNHPGQWRELKLKGRAATVLFDGDLAKNPMVWRETDKARRFLFERTGVEACLLELWSASVEAAKLSTDLDVDQKVGIDEYLTRIGGFFDAMDLRTPMLPPEPEKRTEHKPGDWRVRPGCKAIVEELVRSQIPGGADYWETRSLIGMEILEIRRTRLPGEDEVRTGTISDDGDSFATEEAHVRFHVLPVGADPEYDEVATYDVRVPSSALAATRTSDWNAMLSKGVMRVPAEVLAHPHFPPRDMSNWLAAVKLASDPDITNGWSRMGWVPTGRGGAFLVGDKVIAATEEEERSTALGLTTAQNPRVRSWGVQDSYHSMTHREWQQALVKDVRDAVNTVYGAFRDRSTAAIVLSLMLRPTMPLRGTGSVAFFTGPAGSGKSFAASCVLAGWGARATSWTHQSLPGTAADTIASTEEVLAQAPLHVLDDLAPSSDSGRSASKTASVEDLIRPVFNGTSRRRKGDQPVPDAIAHLLVTGENLSSVESIRQRTWEVDVAGGLLVDGGREKFEAARADGLFTRLTGYAIRQWLVGADGTARDWADVITAAEEMIDNAVFEVTELATERLGEAGLTGAHREIEKTANLLAPTLGLADYYTFCLRQLGIDPKTDPVDELFGTGLLNDLVGHALAAAEEHARHTPGRLALKAVALLLSTGKAHLTNPVTPGAPPAGTDAEKMAAGWQLRGDTWLPQGQAIGVTGRTAKGLHLVILNATAAFTQAAKEYPNLIPAGSTARAAWASLNGELELVPGGIANPGGRIRLTDGEASGSGDNRVFGLGVLWDGLMGLAE